MYVCVCVCVCVCVYTFVQLPIGCALCVTLPTSMEHDGREERKRGERSICQLWKRREGRGKMGKAIGERGEGRLSKISTHTHTHTSRARSRTQNTPQLAP